MKEAIRREIIYDLQESIRILEKPEESDIEELKKLSDHSIEDVAVHKDLDVISVTVLIYSLYKIIPSLSKDNYSQVLNLLGEASKSIQGKNFGQYNQSIKNLFTIVEQKGSGVREHLSTVMQAARIKKGTVLLQHGLSIGQAAGLMGLSNWDLQQYAAKTTAYEPISQTLDIKKRWAVAAKIFGV